MSGAKSDLFYGASGTLKTSNIGKAALWAYKKFNKPTRLISADGGGWQPIESLVEAGIVVPWMLRDRDNLIECIDKACKGYWPADPDNPHSFLLSPFIIRYAGKCPKCGEEITSGKPVQQFPCPKCKTVTTFTMKRAANPDNDLSKFAMVAYEGLTSFGDAMMSHLQATKASLSQDPSYIWKDGDTEYAGGNMTYFGFVQQRLCEFVASTNSLPVEKVIWTALESRGEDEVTKSPIMGPAIVGKKSTGKAGAWFGNMLHFDTVMKGGLAEIDPKVKSESAMVPISTEFRMYLRPHAEALSRIMFPAKSRAPFQFAGELPAWMEPDVGKLYDKIDELQQRAVTQVQGGMK